MNNNEQNSSLSLGCSIAGLVFFGLVLLILLSAKDSGAACLIMLSICIYLIYNINKELKTRKSNHAKSSDIRLLQIELNKELTNWPDVQQLTIDEYLTDQITMLQRSEKNQNFSILRYNRHTEIADYRVYHFKELASWYLHIEETEDSALFFTIRQVTEIAVVFEISYNKQNIRHYIQLYKGKPLSQPVFAEYREKLKHIQRFLSCIKPESPNPNIPI